MARQIVQGPGLLSANLSLITGLEVTFKDSEDIEYIGVVIGMRRNPLSVSMKPQNEGSCIGEYVSWDITFVYTRIHILGSRKKDQRKLQATYDTTIISNWLFISRRGTMTPRLIE